MNEDKYQPRQRFNMATKKQIDEKQKYHIYIANKEDMYRNLIHDYPLQIGIKFLILTANLHNLFINISINQL